GAPRPAGRGDRGARGRGGGGLRRCGGHGAALAHHRAAVAAPAGDRGPLAAGLRAVRPGRAGRGRGAQGTGTGAGPVGRPLQPVVPARRLGADAGVPGLAAGADRLGAGHVAAHQPVLRRSGYHDGQCADGRGLPRGQRLHVPGAGMPGRGVVPGGADADRGPGHRAAPPPGPGRRSHAYPGGGVMRRWHEAVADLGDWVPGGVPALGLLLLMLTVLAAAGWYWFPEWWRALVRTLKQLVRSLFRRRTHPEEPAAAAPVVSQLEPEPEPEPAADHLPAVAAEVLVLSADELAAQGRF